MFLRNRKRTLKIKTENKSTAGAYDGSELVFKKADLQIVIEYAGSNSSPVAWNYSVNFVWA